MRRLRPLTVLLIACCLAQPGASLADVMDKKFRAASRYYIKGERALQAGDLDVASDYFERSVASTPHFAEGHLGLGHVAIRQNQFESALKHYRRAEEVYGDYGEQLMKIRMQRYMGAQDDIGTLRDSITLLRTSSTQSPAIIEKEVMRLENTISQLEAVESPDRSDEGEVPSELQFYIGNALFQLDRLDEAIQAWETCRTARPKFAMVHNNLALAYWRAGRVDDAKVSLALAEELGFPVHPQFKADLNATP